MPLLGRERGTQVFRDLDENPERRDVPRRRRAAARQRPVLRDGQALEDRVRALAEDGSAPLGAVVLDLEGVNFIDSQGAEQLAAILELVESDGATLRLARVKPTVLAVLARTASSTRLGADRIHGNVQRAVEAQREGSSDEHAAATAGPAPGDAR